MSEVKDLFDRALALKPGERITIPFQTHGELKSKKTLLFREKKAYKESLKGTLLRKEVFIGQEVNVKKKVFKLHLSTTAESADWLKNAVVVSEDGSEVKPLKITETNELNSELERIKRLQEQEG